MVCRLLQPVNVTPQLPVTVGVPVEINTTVFVRGIPREATTQTVEGHFKTYGEILSCHVIRHKDASTNKGIAFVKFRDATAAQRAINCNHPGVMDQREVFAEWAHPRPASSASRALPDQQVVAGASSAPPHVYFTSPAAGHVMSNPRFLPFGNVQPWVVGGSSSAVAPYGSPYGGHVLGFPAHAGFSGRENYGQELFPASYIPVNTGYVSAAPGVISAGSGSFHNQLRYQSEIPVADPEAESEAEGHEDDSLSSSVHLSDRERIELSRKGKEKEI